MASCGKQDTIIAWSCSKLLHGFSMMTWRLVMLSVLCQALGQDDKAALIIIDVQDCFLESGTLPVPEGKEVIPVINRIRSAYEDAFSMVVLSQDWHCSDHVSFASQHPGHRPFDEVTLQYDSKGHLCTSSSVPPSFPYAHACSQVRYNISQSLWPDHCIMNVTSGPTSSAIDSRLTRKPNDEIILKGNDCEVDSYSAFNSNGGLRHTRLHRLLQRNNISVVYVVGLALDYCVYYTSLDAHSLVKYLPYVMEKSAVKPDMLDRDSFITRNAKRRILTFQTGRSRDRHLHSETPSHVDRVGNTKADDAAKAGYKTYTVADATRGIAVISTQEAVADLKTKGVHVIQSSSLAGLLSVSGAPAASM